MVQYGMLQYGSVEVWYGSGTLPVWYGMVVEFELYLDLTGLIGNVL